MGLAFWISWAALAPSSWNTDSACRLVLLDRQIAQQNSAWSVLYRMAYEGERGIELSASDISVDYDAWVANSRSKPHTIPRSSHINFALSETSSIWTTVIAGGDDRERCRERITVRVMTGDQPVTNAMSARTDFLPIQLAPGQVFWIHLALEHDHFLYGRYDPLLGNRQFEIRLGPCRLVDSLPLDIEHNSTVTVAKLSTPPNEHRDSRQFRSPPDCLYLAAHIPAHQYFRFDDMPIRYGSSFRLRFWYLVAVGTEGPFHVRVLEYQDGPGSWSKLEGGFDDEIPEQGQWQLFERTFSTRDDTTTLILDFRIVGATIGEVWIDDIELVGCPDGSDW